MTPAPNVKAALRCRAADCSGEDASGFTHSSTSAAGDYAVMPMCTGQYEDV